MYQNIDRSAKIKKVKWKVLPFFFCFNFANWPSNYQQWPIKIVWDHSASLLPVTYVPDVVGANREARLSCQAAFLSFSRSQIPEFCPRGGDSLCTCFTVLLTDWLFYCSSFSAFNFGSVSEVGWRKGCLVSSSLAVSRFVCMSQIMTFYLRWRPGCLSVLLFLCQYRISAAVFSVKKGWFFASLYLNLPASESGVCSYGKEDGTHLVWYLDSSLLLVCLDFSSFSYGKTRVSRSLAVILTACLGS